MNLQHHKHLRSCLTCNKSCTLTIKHNVHHQCSLQYQIYRITNYLKRWPPCKRSTCSGTIIVFQILEACQESGAALLVCNWSIHHLDGHELVPERLLSAENALLPDCRLDIEPLDKIKTCFYWLHSSGIWCNVK